MLASKYRQGDNTYIDLINSNKRNAAMSANVYKLHNNLSEDEKITRYHESLIENRAFEIIEDRDELAEAIDTYINNDAGAMDAWNSSIAAIVNAYSTQHELMAHATIKEIGTKAATAKATFELPQLIENDRLLQEDLA